MADELPPCTLGFLFNDRHNYKCSAERRERCYGVAMGYVDRAGKPRLNPGRPGRRGRHDYFPEVPRDGRAGNPGGTRKDDDVQRACCTCMERAVGLHQWMPMGDPGRGGRRRPEVDLYLLRCAYCVSRGQAVPTSPEFAAGWQRAQRCCRAAEQYSKAYLARCAADQHLAAAAQLCQESDVATFPLEQDLDSWRDCNAIGPGKRLRDDDAEEQRRTFESRRYGLITGAYEVLEPDGVDAQAARALARQRRAAVEAREARVAEHNARQAAVAASGAAGPPGTDWRLAGV